MKAMLSSGRLERFVRRALALHCPAPCKLLCGLPQIGRGLKRVVKAIGEVGQADDESQFHDLLLTIVLPQIFEHIITHSGRGPRYHLNVMKRGFVFYVEGYAA